MIALAQYMIRTCGRDTVLVTKVKGHAEDVDDTAADLGRRHQSDVLTDACRGLLKARSYWYPIMLDLHRFMVAIARVSVNHDGRCSTAPDLLFGDQGSKPDTRMHVWSILILPLSLVLLVSWVGHGFNFMGVVFLVLTLLPGLTVLALFVNLLPF